MLPYFSNIREDPFSKCARGRLRGTDPQNNRISFIDGSAYFNNALIIQVLKLLFGELSRLPRCIKMLCSPYRFVLIHVCFVHGSIAKFLSSRL